MPIVAPIMKVENCKKYGANVIVHGKDIGESRERQIHHMKVAGRHFYGTENLIWAGFRPVGNTEKKNWADYEQHLSPVFPCFHGQKKVKIFFLFFLNIVASALRCPQRKDA